MRLRRLFAALAVSAAFFSFGMTGFASEAGETGEPADTAAAQPPIGASVSVTIASGRLILAQAPVEVFDCDGSGTLTVDDALYCAHDTYFEGGAAAGYDSAVNTSGVAMTKLWGVESVSGFGCFLNNVRAASLDAPVSNGDLVSAFVYVDAQTLSDTYSFFNVDRASVESGDPLTLTLYAVMNLEAEQEPVTVPVAGAAITIDGEDSGFVTDADGKVELRLPRKAGAHVVSAVSGAQLLVPPVCTVEVTGVIPAAAFYGVFGASAAALLAYTIVSAARAKKKRPDEDYVTGRY